MAVRIAKRMKAAWGALKGVPYPDPYGVGNSGAGTMFLRNDNLPGGSSDMDYAYEAGALHLNSIVAAVIGWIATQMQQTVPQVVRRNADGEDTAQPDHPLVKLLNRPNPSTSWKNIYRPLLLDWHGSGDAYLMKARAASRRVVELRYIPANSIRPDPKAVGGKLVSNYIYTVGGRQMDVAPSELIHLRNGIDPERPQNGLSDLRPVLREIVTENEAGTYTVQAVKSPIPGIVLWPDGEAVMDDDDERSALAKEFQERFSGNKRFRTMVMSTKMGMETAGFDPEQMALDLIRRYPEQRICAALRIPPMVMGYAAGKDEATYANYGEALRAALNNNALPTLALFAEELTNQLLQSEPEYGRQEDLFVRFNTSKMEGLKEDQAVKTTSLTKAAGGAYMAVNEARRRDNLDPHPDPEHDGIRQAKAPPDEGKPDGQDGEKKPKK